MQQMCLCGVCIWEILIQTIHRICIKSAVCNADAAQCDKGPSSFNYGFWMFTQSKGNAMRRRQGDQLILFLAFAGALTVVVCLMGPDYSVEGTVDMIMSFWDAVLPYRR
ncbi:MAG: hypothetical protein CMJ19_22045 [Phycisphaeraceae bacterium]|nr:hypothetical protein [Phycisphaeraceae bacterium]